MSHLFYINDPQYHSNPLKSSSVESYSFVLWSPTTLKIRPAGLYESHFIVWWIMHYLKVFANNDYSLFLVYDGPNLIHRSCIFPKYFRFPFMAEIDLQIGDTWTDSHCRNKGIATMAISEIVKLTQKPNRIFWYIVEEDNIPSIKVIEKSGFVKYGYGRRRKRFGLPMLGFFEIESLC